jgi:hypothetical protein
VQVETQQPIQSEIAFSHAVVGAVDLARERQDQSNGMLGYRIGGVSGHTHDFHTQIFGGCQVNMVETGAAQRYQTRA